ncbi:MAG TPA: HAD-IC family P-type ATPase [Methylobacter sp.]|jgi:Ca2+-transporting ATPase
MRPAPVQGSDWHCRPAEEVLAQFTATPEGLSSGEAAQRLAVNGPNELKESKPISPLQIFIDQFKSLIIWILIAAGAISGVLGDVVDVIAIYTVVILNAAIGFYQELNAQKSIAELKKMVAPQAKVRRDGQVTSIPASKIVVGDILALDAGDLVAADARLLAAASLTCIESALTGESEAEEKHAETLAQEEIPLGDRKNMVFMGTSVATGTGQAVVVATAMNTELGRIAGLLDDAEADQDTPLQRKLDVFGRILVWAALAIVALLFGLGWLRGIKLTELTMTSISLAVAAIPEGLPAVVTVALSLGVLRMARRRALVRKLPAVETLGSTNVICTDKTGTLTAGEMTVRALYIANQCYEVSGEGYGPDGEVRFEGNKATAQHAAPLLELANVILGCNNAHLVHDDGTWKVVGDTTEGALLVAGIKAGGDRERIERELPKYHEIPFDSDRKRSTVIRRMPDGKLRALINGAPGELLERSTRFYTPAGMNPLTEQERGQIQAQISAMAQQALRVLGSAYRELDNEPSADLTADAVERDLVFVGLSGMYDPPRQEVKEAIAKCRSAGIRAVMITGDHPHTAIAIAREIGLAAAGDMVISGIELNRMPEQELRLRAPKIAVYARVTAEHKQRIIRAWKANDAVVAMTGDGVNDAPAVRSADIGITMGRTGTEVTKEAADMIIADDNFATIIAAVEEGRGIYANIRKTLQYLLAGNTGELLLMTLCVIIGLPTPLLPIHLLWINLVTDGLPALCLATDPIDPEVMKRRPRSRSENITDHGFLRPMLLTSFLTATVAFAVYYSALQSETTETARTAAFATLVFAELWRAFGARSETKPVWRIPLLNNINLIIVVAISFGLQVWSQQNATFGRFLKSSYLPFTDCLVLLTLGALPLLVLELVKVGRHLQRQRRLELIEAQKANATTTTFSLAVKRFLQMDGLVSAAAFSHYAFFSLFPLIVLAVSLASLFINSERAGTEIIAYVEAYVPISGEMQSNIFDTINGVVKARGPASALALLMQVWSAMQLFSTLISATRRAWGEEPVKWWRLPLKGLLFLILMVMLVLLSLAMPVLAKITKGWLFVMNGLAPWVFTLVSYVLPALVIVLCLSLFYKLAPNRPMRFVEVWHAALSAAVLLQVAVGLLVTFIDNFAALNPVYGAFGGIMALLLWIYLSGCIVIFGACLSAAQANISVSNHGALPQGDKP